MKKASLITLLFIGLASFAYATCIITPPITAPTNLTLPTISGIVQVSQPLTITPGTWSGNPTPVITEQWYHEGTAIVGATGSSYTLLPGDISDLITVKETATNSAGTVSVYSTLYGPTIGATVFYVDSVGGLDSNPGTLASPWKTLLKVNAQTNSTLVPGTSVLFKRGDVWRISDYADQQFIPNASHLNGTAGNPIVFDAYGTGANPIFQGSVAAATTADWTNIGTNLWQSTKQFPPIIQAGNLSGVNGFPANNANDIGNIIWNTAGVISAGTMVGGSLSGYQCGGTGPNNILLCGPPSSAGQWWFVANTAAGGNPPCATAAAAPCWTVQVFSSTGNPGNQATTAMPGLELAQDKSTIRAFQINYITFQNLTLQYGGGSTINTNNSSNLIFRDITTLWGGGGNQGGAFVRYGDVLDVEGTPSNNVLAERFNSFQQYDSGLTLQSGGGVVHCDNITFRNNIMNATGNPLFIQISASSAGSTMNSFAAYNNTGYSPTRWSIGQRPNGNFPAGWYIKVDSSVAMTAKFENNISASDAINSVLMKSFRDFVGFYTQDYNIWQGSGTNVPTTFWSASTLSREALTLWATNYPAETHGQIDVDPLFTSPSTGDLTLQGGSPALTAGVNLYSSGVVWDFNKNPRPTSGPFTIGAYQ